MDLDSKRRFFDQPIVYSLRQPFGDPARRQACVALGFVGLGLAILEELQEVSVHPLDSPQEFLNPNGFGS